MKLTELIAKLNGKSYTAVIEVRSSQGEDKTNDIKEISEELKKETITVI